MTIRTHILTGLVFLCLLIGTGMMQTHLKNMPQLFMLTIGVLTLGSFIFNKKSISTGLFYFLTALMLFISYFMLTILIFNLISPTKLIGENGEELHPVANMNLIWGVLFGFILSPLTVLLYHKTITRNRIMEITVTALFLVSTIILYIVYEL